MVGTATALALGMPGYQELAVLLVIGLLIFGRRLPEVGRTLGRTMLQLRKGFQDFKHQLDADEGLRDARASVHELKKAVDLPRHYTSPQRALEKLIEEAPPEAGEDVPPSGSSTPSSPPSGTTD